MKTFTYLNDLKQEITQYSNNHKKEPQPFNFLNHMSGYDWYKLTLFLQYKGYTQQKTQSVFQGCRQKQQKSRSV